MTFKTEEGELIKGNSPEEIVTDLRNGSRFASDQNLTEYMIGFAQRHKDWSGKQVRTDNYENFVLDLTTTGFLIEQPA